MFFSDNVNLEKTVDDFNDKNEGKALVRIHVVGILGVGQSNMGGENYLQHSDQNYL